MSYPFFYDRQLKRYLVQFMEVFRGLSVAVGRTDTEEVSLIPVPINYASIDKVAAAVAANNTKNTPIRLPTMWCNMVDMQLNVKYMAGTGMTHSQTYLPQGGFFADDVRTLERLRPLPYLMTVELGFMVSNTDHKFQILEQIMMLFSPTLQIQTSDERFDWTKITVIELKSIQMDERYPVGTEANRAMTTTLRFDVPIYISAPADCRDEFVRDVMVRIGTLSTDGSMEDIIDAFDDEGLLYQNIASATDIVTKATASNQNNGTDA